MDNESHDADICWACLTIGKEIPLVPRTDGGLGDECPNCKRRTYDPQKRMDGKYVAKIERKKQW